MKPKFTFLNNCVDWNRQTVNCEGGLTEMIERSLEITRKTFLKHVDSGLLAEMAGNMGYCKYRNQGLTMASDYHITYYRSKLFGSVVYYFKHSGIEFVFCSPEQLDLFIKCRR
jgi:hypothetical protein